MQIYIQNIYKKICFLQLLITWLGWRVTQKFLLHPWLVYLPVSEQGLSTNLLLSSTFTIEVSNCLSTLTVLVLPFCPLNDFSLLGMFIFTLHPSTPRLWRLSWWSRVERIQGKYPLIWNSRKHFLKNKNKIHINQLLLKNPLKYALPDWRFCFLFCILGFFPWKSS